jgi:hypothetical protein
MTLSVSSRNQRSTRFNQDDEVGGEAQVVPRVLGEPGLHVGVFVGGVVVQNHMYRKAFRHFPVDRTQELQELLVAVPVQALADHRAVRVHYLSLLPVGGGADFRAASSRDRADQRMS